VWRQVTGQLIAADDSTIISILGQPGSSFMIGLDDVSVNGPAIAAIPEPSTWAMMMLGIGFVTYRRRKAAPIAA
jgi:hypothetical protein